MTIPVLLVLRFGERELAVDVQPVPTVPVLQMPVARPRPRPRPRPRVLEEVAPVARQGPRERCSVPAPGERRPSRPDVGLELPSVEFHREARVDPVAPLLEPAPV